jgi:hypothetical protein
MPPRGAGVVETHRIGAAREFGIVRLDRIVLPTADRTYLIGAARANDA